VSDLSITDFINGFGAIAEAAGTRSAGGIVNGAAEIIALICESLQGDEWIRRDEALIHTSAVVSKHAFIEGPAVVGRGCRVSHGAYLRDGVWLESDVVIGTHCEIKSSFIFAGTRIAHLNYVGNSLIGADVNIEAGAVLANHWNERNGALIELRLAEGKAVETGVTKFGAIVGDGSRFGANAVTSPGTVLAPGSIVGRLELVDQRPAP
jgi:UDP-N-acetylglucosamine diphosphorylase / glucose-1-phosphate thymidylyltransferase / UDP-N-acetylgalactosamine diphosphorylase / glucosamine-1-phosphate N-acetyltransferase / galactosamine-1-phosphate N-acetyltransferase